jgi:hypothetical protein
VVESGPKELALELESKGYAGFDEQSVENAPQSGAAA